MERFRDYGSSGSYEPPPGGGVPQNMPPGYAPPYPPPPPQQEMGNAKVIGLSALACCFPFIGPLIALIIGIVERAKKGSVTVIVIGAIMLLMSAPICGIFAAVAIPLFIAAAPPEVQQEFEQKLDDFIATQSPEIGIKVKEAELKQNLHAIQLAIERYGIDHEYMYPADIPMLMDAQYMDGLPNNPFTDQPMKPVLLTDSPEERQGNFTYLSMTESGKRTKYTLLVYGSLATTESSYPGGSGPAAVIMTLDNGETLQP